jgi:hypothetical protein
MPPNFYNDMQRNDPNRDLNPFIAGLRYEIFKYDWSKKFHVKLVGADSFLTLDSAYYHYEEGKEKEAIEKCKNWLRERGVKC